MVYPIGGATNAEIAPTDAVSMETANAARAPPKTSSGRAYIFTLKARIAKKLSETPAEAQRAEGAAGMAAPASARAAAATHTRRRASGGARPRSTSRFESHPPANPPIAANTGGIQAYQAASRKLKPC